MPGFHGLDVEQTLALSRAFGTAADRLDSARRSVGHEVASSAWHGPVAGRFRSTWDSDAAVRVRDAATALRDASELLRRNAEDQRTTSTHSDGTSGTSADAVRTSGGGSAGGGGGAGRDPLFDELLPFLPKLREWLEDVLDSGPGVSIPASEWIGRLDLRVGWGQIASFIPILSNAVTTTQFVTEMTDPSAPVGHRVRLGVNYLIDSFAGGLRSTPATYLAGAALSSVSAAVNAGIDADWSAENRLSVVDFIASDPEEALGGAVEAVVNFLPTLVGGLIPASSSSSRPKGQQS